MSRAVVEGRIDIEFDEDSSDSEASVPERTVNDAPKDPRHPDVEISFLAADFAATTVDNLEDDEEIEYFGNKPNNAKLAPKNTTSSSADSGATAKSGNALASLIGTALVQGGHDSQNVEDEFGISYQSRRRKPPASPNNHDDSTLASTAGITSSLLDEFDDSIADRLLNSKQNKIAAQHENDVDDDDEFGDDEENEERNLVDEDLANNENDQTSSSSQTGPDKSADAIRLALMRAAEDAASQERARTAEARASDLERIAKAEREQKQQLEALKQKQQKSGTTSGSVLSDSSSSNDALNFTLARSDIDQPIMLNDNSSNSSGAPHSPNSSVLESSSSGSSTSGSEKVGDGILESAKKALADVTEAYGAGLGDQEVHLLQPNYSSSKSEGSATAAAATAAATGVSGLGLGEIGLTGIDVIEEGDEEEEEEEERQEAAQKVTMLRAQESLEAQWEAVAETSAVSDNINPTSISSDGKGGGVWTGGGADSAVQLQMPTATSMESGDQPPSSSAFAPASTTSRSSSSNSAAAPPSRIVFMGCYKALRVFKNMEITPELRASIVTTESTASGGGGGGWFKSAPKPLSYSKTAQSDLELPFLVAQVDYAPSATASHMHMLLTLYAFFMHPQSYAIYQQQQQQQLVDEDPAWLQNFTSSDWENIGFQGLDPGTDLNRSMKMLSVIQMLSFIEKDPELARASFDSSQSALASSLSAASSSAAERNAAAGKRTVMDNSWPFMCVGIMFTKEALQALRRGELNEKINKRHSVMDVLNEFHRACFAEFYSLLQAQPTTHHAVHLASLRKQCETQSMKLLKKYKSRVKELDAKVGASASSSSSSSSSCPATGASFSTGQQTSSNGQNQAPAATGAEDITFTSLDNLAEMSESSNSAATSATSQSNSNGNGWTSIFSGASNNNSSNNKAARFQVN